MKTTATFTIDTELLEPFAEIVDRKAFNKSKLINGFIRRFVETDGDIEYIMKSYNPNWRELKSKKSTVEGK